MIIDSHAHYNNNPESSNPDSGKIVDPDTFSPCWMLNPDYHGKGYACEALFHRGCRLSR